MANIWENAISILARNLNSGHITVYHVTKSSGNRVYSVYRILDSAESTPSITASSEPEKEEFC